ncbi:MAG: hypothetical protein WBQ38_06165 [Ignavibacteria bacterium]
MMQTFGFPNGQEFCPDYILSVLEIRTDVKTNHKFFIDIQLDL